MLRAWISIVLISLFATTIFAQDTPKKRVLTHADYDIWNTATGVTLSPNGQFVVYVQTPPTGDAFVVVRNVKTNSDTKIAIGGRPVPTPGAPVADEETEDQVPAPPATPVTPATAPNLGSLTGGPQFTPDSKFLYFPLVPTKAEVEKAKSDKKKLEEMPRTVLACLDLASSQIVKRYESVKSFNILGDGAGVLVLMKEPKPEPIIAPKEQVAPPKQVRNAKPIRKVAAAYPRTALKDGTMGKVKARLTIGVGGEVIDVEILESSPPGIFDDAVTKAVKQYKFEGDGTQYFVDQEVVFKLEN